MNRPLPVTLAIAAAACLCHSGCKHLPGSDGENKEPAAESDKERDKRTAAEAAFYAECANQGEHGGTITGRDGWFFAASELLQVSRVKTTSAATTSIADYAQQLRGRGIDLIVVPVPPKALVYADKIRGAKVPMKSRRPARLDSVLRAAMDELEARKIKVVDLMPALIAHRDDKGGTAFTRTGTTWSPYGVQIAVKEIAAAVKNSKAGRGSVTGISMEPVTIPYAGGLLSGADGKLKAESFSTVKVGRISGDKVRSLSFNTSGGSLLLMGGGDILAWREANNPQGSTGAFCSLADQLAAELSLIPDVLANAADGRNAPRLRILRERTSGRAMLGSTRTVVWVISSLDLASQNWQRVPLELQFTEEAPELQLR